MSSEAETKSPHEWTGQCYCGKVKWKVCGPMLFSAYCHCNACRGFGGSPYYEFGAFNLDHYTILEGADQIIPIATIQGSPYVRNRCGNCGYTLSCTKDVEPKWLSIPLGAINEYNGVPARTMHLNYAFKLPWVDFEHDGLPKLPGMPEE